MTTRIDAHCHLWRLERGDYGWLGGEGLEALRRDFEPHDLAAVHSPAGIRRAVVVQAAPTVAETQFLLDLAETAPAVAGVVGWVDLASPDAAETLDEIASPHLLGVRPMLQDLAEDDWIVTAPTAAAIAALRAASLRFDALVMPRHLRHLVRFVEAHPDLPVIVDHAAKPALGAPADDPRHAAWREGMAALGRTGAYVKISGLFTEMRPDQRATPAAAAATLRPLVDDLLEWFGSDRIAWGSDWPVLTLADEMSAWDETTALLLAELSAEARTAILGGNAATFYGLEDAR
ncbi:amidohydrolase [Acuticoccus sp. I52.16.1]|uniref:amidohydrolase family protein n=1 Tax=Acuticoccus sp. I52.16.1 TaxID=2928472 RepID=UPI001FD08D3D|nr:amidohydrolase family protein [Acuticoccus sp. I52.16.1]UOM35341.1 amidohydrolase family protein [Acuticoccus sp. I52.16.1]